MTDVDSKKATLIPKYLSEIFCQILTQSGTPIEIGKLLELAATIRGEITIEFIKKKTYVAATSHASPLMVAEYPSFKLRSTTKFPDLSGIIDGIRYLTSASKILFATQGYVEVREIIQRIEREKLYKFPTSTPEYWMCGFLQEHKKFFSQRGALKIGLKEWDANSYANNATKLSRLPTKAKTKGDITPTIHEANLESILIEHLDVIEPGLALVQRQYVCPGVGRIDLLCQDKHGNLVVLELKKFGARQDSIIDQVTRYMGWVQKHVAKGNQKVRGIIVVAKADDKLHYAVSAIPHLQIKTFNLTIG